MRNLHKKDGSQREYPSPVYRLVVYQITLPKIYAALAMVFRHLVQTLIVFFRPPS